MTFGMLARDLRKKQYGSEVVTSVSSGFGTDAAFVVAQIGNTADHFAKPFSRYWKSIENKFVFYKQQWEQDVGFSSSMSQICMNLNYQRIIGLGHAVLPHIFEDLKNETKPWFWALTSITGEDPVSSEHRGDFKAMAEDWEKWAIDNGYKI